MGGSYTSYAVQTLTALYLPLLMEVWNFLWISEFQSCNCNLELLSGTSLWHQLYCYWPAPSSSCHPTFKTLTICWYYTPKLMSKWHHTAPKVTKLFTLIKRFMKLHFLQFNYCYPYSLLLCATPKYCNHSPTKLWPVLSTLKLSNCKYWYNRCRHKVPLIMQHIMKYVSHPDTHNNQKHVDRHSLGKFILKKSHTNSVQFAMQRDQLNCLCHRKQWRWFTCQFSLYYRLLCLGGTLHTVQKFLEYKRS